jgi:hypothetical protein
MSRLPEAGLGISRDGGARDALFAMGARCGEELWTRVGLSVKGTGTVRAGGGSEVRFGTMGGGGTRAEALARSPFIRAGAGGSGGSGRVTRGGAISSSLVSSAESTGTRETRSSGACAVSESSVACWPCTVLGGLDAATTLSPSFAAEGCRISAACENAPTASSCGTRVCASS